MPEPLPFLLGMAVVWAVLYMASRFLPFKKRGVEMEPWLLMIRTRRLNDWIGRTAQRRPFLWKVFSNVGVFVVAGQMIFAIYTLSKNLVLFIYRPEQAVSVTPFIPGVTVGLGPLTYLLLPVVVVMVSHELAHGIVARLEKIPVKSAGIIVAFIIFGAFVEPDEEEFKKAPRLSRLRVLAAGSFTNLIIALLTITIMMGAFQGPLGIIVSEVGNNGPAANAGLRAWDVVKGVNGVPIHQLSDFRSFMSSVMPGTKLMLETSRGIIEVTATRGENNGIGAKFWVLPFFNLRLLPIHDVQALFLTYAVLSGIHMLNLAVGVFNMLPLYPLDGENYFVTLTEAFFKGHRLRRALRWGVNLFSAGILFSNILFTATQLSVFLVMEL